MSNFFELLHQFLGTVDPIGAPFPYLDGAKHLKNLSDPIAPGDAATKAYVDAGDSGGGGGGLLFVATQQGVGAPLVFPVNPAKRYLLRMAGTADNPIILSVPGIISNAFYTYMVETLGPAFASTYAAGQQIFNGQGGRSFYGSSEIWFPDTKHATWNGKGSLLDPAQVLQNAEVRHGALATDTDIVSITIDTQGASGTFGAKFSLYQYAE